MINLNLRQNELDELKEAYSELLMKSQQLSMQLSVSKK
jgi:hypothetical protein